jgi:hypothetical protein
LIVEARLSPGEWAFATGRAEMLVLFLATDAPWGLFLVDDVSFLASASRFRECGAVLEKSARLGLDDLRPQRCVVRGTAA